MATKRYKFLREGFKSDSGFCVWEIGKWKKHEGELEMCEAGFHCSKGIYQAFSYVQGEILAEVEVKGKSIKKEDKEVYSDMRILRAWKWQKKDSVSLSIYCAELCLDNFEKIYPDDKRPREAIEATKRWLEGKITEKELDAAGSAAGSAAWSAGSAAGSAAWSAAGSAAWSAVSAARSAARSALTKNISKWMDERLNILGEIK